jgi:hypothetical protein
MKHWTEEEVNWFKENYPLIGKIACANYLNKTSSSIRAKASKLGLKQNKNSDFFKQWQDKAAQSKIGKKRPEQVDVITKLHQNNKLKLTEKSKRILSEKMKQRIKDKDHPKGMKGKNHSNDTKIKISQASAKIWENPEYILNQPENRQKLSDRMSLMQFQGKLRNRYSRGSQGKRKDLNDIYFRSSWEANYARYLNFLKSKGLIYNWEFEPDTFWFENIKRGVRSYLPDFKVWDFEYSEPYYVEIKGWMDNKSKTKLKRMEKYYPHIRIEVIEKKQYMEIKHKLSRIIPFWE